MSFFNAFRDISQTLFFISFRVELSHFGCYDTIKFRIFYRRIPDADIIARFYRFFPAKQIEIILAGEMPNLLQMGGFYGK